MLTTTKREFDYIRFEIQEAYRQAVGSFTDRLLVGGKQEVSIIEELALYLDAISSFETSDVPYISQSEYLDEEDIRAIYNRVRDLQR